jgi:hypothetical protein
MLTFPSDAQDLRIREGIREFFRENGETNARIDLVLALWGHCKFEIPRKTFYHPLFLPVKCRFELPDKPGVWKHKPKANFHQILQSLFPDAYVFGHSYKNLNDDYFIVQNQLIIAVDVTQIHVLAAPDHLIHDCKDQLMEILFDTVETNVKRNSPYINLVYPTRDSLSLISAPLAKAPTLMEIETLYGQEGFDKFNTLLELLSTDDMTGLFLLEGPPGTGKTSLIKAATREINKSFIFVPSDVGRDLGRSEYTPFFMEQRGNILVFEDGENIVQRASGVPRSAATMALLNMADGMLADIMRNPLILTVNCKNSEMDPALLRAGRLQLHWIVDLITAANASKFTELLATNYPTNYKTVLFTEPVSVADIYQAASIVK